MSLILTLFLAGLVLAIALHAWLGAGEDLSVHDHAVELGGGESFSRATSPSGCASDWRFR